MTARFAYRFLLVAADPQRLDQLSESVKADFPRAQIHETLEPSEVADYCRANVYDLIWLASDVEDVESVRRSVRELDNDNRDTGILAFAPAAGPVADLTGLMFAPSVEDKSYLEVAKVLITLKK